jgi:hypothetical protein
LITVFYCATLGTNFYAFLGKNLPAAEAHPLTPLFPDALICKKSGKIHRDILQPVPVSCAVPTELPLEKCRHER